MLGFAIYSLLVLAFIGGVLALSQVYQSNSSNREKRFLISLVLISAIHLIVLMRVPLAALLGGGLVIGLFCFIKQAYLGNFNGSKSIFLPSRIFIGLLLLMFLFKGVFEGISGWDARSIYFFHAKVIFFEKAFPIEAWKLPAYEFSHLDYPKLTASLAALISTAIGYWNEYWPKLATGSLLILLHLGIYSMPLQFIERVVIQATMFSVPGYFLWVGEQDGYLAGFAFLGILYTGWGLRYQHKLWTQIGLACLCLGMQIKNEGLAFGGIVVFVATLFRPRAVFRAASSLPVFLTLSPVALWSFYRQFFSIRNDLSVGFNTQRIFERIVSWDLFWRDFLTYFFLNTDILRSLFVALVGFVILKVLRKGKWDVGTLLALTSYSCYCFVLLSVYLSTHWEVVEHLKTSVDRVAFTPALVLLGAVILASPMKPASPEKNGNGL